MAPNQSTSGRGPRVDPHDGCPACGTMFADGWDARLDGNAKVFRNRKGELVAEIRFTCPDCGTPLVMEDASSAVVAVDTDRATDRQEGA